MIASCEFGCEDSARIPSGFTPGTNSRKKFQRGSVGGMEWRMVSATRMPVKAA